MMLSYMTRQKKKEIQDSSKAFLTKEHLPMDQVTLDALMDHKIPSNSSEDDTSSNSGEENKNVQDVSGDTESDTSDSNDN